MKLWDYFTASVRSLWNVVCFILICTIVPLLLVWLLADGPAQFFRFLTQP